MKKDGSGEGKKRGGATSKLYGLLRIVSSGASTVARSAVNVMAQSMADRDDGTGGAASDVGHDQVLWAGFDKLEVDNNRFRRVLLLACKSGYQVWDVEEADNVSALVSKHDGPASFLQMVPKPILPKDSVDKFVDTRPLLVVCADGAFSDGYYGSSNGNAADNFMPTVVRFYSLSSHSYVHMLKFRSIIYSVRCSSRVVAICQGTQIHCIDALTLERDYAIVTNPIIVSVPDCGGVGYGPLAVGPRWLAYSGNAVQGSNPACVFPQQLVTSGNAQGFSSNTNMVAHFAKESSKQLAAGLVTLGEAGYKKLSQYYSEFIPESHASVIPALKVNGTSNGRVHDSDNVGMVVVRDIVNRHVIAQFRAHKSPISALCFDPSGTLLVTASVQGHNINVFKIFPTTSPGDATMSYCHVYRLQRGFTNAVIQDISFSDDSHWIMISTSRGTSHLFAIDPYDQASNKPGGPMGGCNPTTLTVVSRIRNGNSGWRDTVTPGRRSSFSGAIASSFHTCKSYLESYVDGVALNSKYYLSVFAPVGSLIQYSLRLQSGVDPTSGSGLTSPFDSDAEADDKILVEAVKKWNICQKKNYRDREDSTDIYGENGSLESVKIYPTEKGKVNGFHTEDDVDKKIAHEEKQPLFISEAELHMHQLTKPLWAKAEIIFEALADVDESLSIHGELEIERIPSRTIEVKSKDLIPALDYVQASKFHYSSNPNTKDQSARSDQNQKPSLHENDDESASGSPVAEDTGTLVNSYSANAHETAYSDETMCVEDQQNLVNIMNNEMKVGDGRHEFD